MAPFDEKKLRAAVRSAAEDQLLGERGQVALLAYLRAFRHHWPAAFGELLGEEGEKTIAELSARRVDPNRYLKLRRIAIENLATRL